MSKQDWGNWQRDYEGFYPPEILAIAAKRVAGLMRLNCLKTAPLALLMESAYLQGLVDAADAIGPDKKQEPESE